MAVAAQLQAIENRRSAFEKNMLFNERYSQPTSQKRTVSDCKGCGAPLTSHEAECSYCKRPNP